MDAITSKTLNIINPLKFRPKAPIFKQFSLIPFKNNINLSLSCSPLCSNSERENVRVLPSGVGEAVIAESKNKILQVVLVSPQGKKLLTLADIARPNHLLIRFPGNTGSIARTCAASAIGLHLVGPLGFPVDDTKLKRAGLDYWPYVVVKVHSSWDEFQEYFKNQDGDKRLLAFTKRGTKLHSEFSYRKGDYLLFGSETSGLPPEVIQDCTDQTFGGGTIRIPMVDTYVRCLNLSVSVGIAAYEAARQLNYEQLQSPSETLINGTNDEKSYCTEDVFA